MGVVYSHSEAEEKALKEKIKEKGFSIFHTNFVDEKGNDTNGDVRQIIFGSKELRKKSINDKAVVPFSNFTKSMGPIKKLLEKYPTFLELHDDNKINKFMNELGIEKREQIDDVLEELKDGIEIIPTPKTTLEKLHWITTLKRKKELQELVKKTGQSRFYSLPMTELDKLTSQGIADAFNLFAEPEFLNEMSLVYAITIFKGYLKSILEIVFELCPELRDDSTKEMSVKDDIVLLKGYFITNIKYDLTQIPEWNSFYEMNLRRNRLIHHQGIPNDEHNRLTGNVGYSRIKTDRKYIIDSLKIIEEIQKIVNNYLRKKFIEPKFIQQMSSEDTLD